MYITDKKETREIVALFVLLIAVIVDAIVWYNLINDPCTTTTTYVIFGIISFILFLISAVCTKSTKKVVKVVKRY